MHVIDKYMIKKSILNRPKLFSKNDLIKKKNIHTIEKLKYIELFLKNIFFLFFMKSLNIS